MKYAPLPHVFGFFFLSASVFAAPAPSPCGDAESLKIKMNLVKDAGQMIYVCGFENPEHNPPPGYKNLSEMKVFSQKDVKNGETPTPPKLLLETTALETHWVKKDKAKLLVDEVWWVNLKPITALRSEVTCKKTGCKVSRPKCVAEPKKPAKKITAKPSKTSKSKSGAAKIEDPLKNLQDALRDPAANPNANLQELTAQVFIQALHGNRRAQSFFLETKIPQGLAAEAADEWQASKSQLRRAKQYGCAR